ncbi:MAG: 16S rRNA (cytosine(967)-C(5))-methyltransferase RsmB [Acutalibacteraceae bacterium]
MTDVSRQTALQALLRVENDNSYSNITLDSVLSKSRLSSADKSFATTIFYGVIEKKLLIDYNIAAFSKIPVNKLDTKILTILRMGMYQLFFMDKVPVSAAVNESVKLCKANKLYSASSYVNAVLRSAAANNQIKYPDRKKGKNKYQSIKYSCPEDIIKLWRQSYGDDITEGLLQSLDGRPPLTARVNTTKTTAQKLRQSLLQNGITVKNSEILENALLLENTGAVEKLQEYTDGLFHIQDTASQICCELLNPLENQTVLDVCSAPGGKTFTIAELMKNKGKIISCDLYPSRLNLVNDGAKRLSLDIISTNACNAAEVKDLPKADRVLCDVPCSGLGIIRRKPELRYKKELGLDTLPYLQYLILCNCSAFVKEGGILVYSTCTLNPSENNLNAEKFLAEHSDFEPVEIKLPKNIRRGFDEKPNELTLFPHINNTDGFFISVFRKR